MCVDICTVNIRVSIRVRGLHLDFPILQPSTTGSFRYAHPAHRSLELTLGCMVLAVYFS
jgi:hypothetical protein